MKWISATVDAAMAVIVALAALQAGSADAQSVIRGPYLQRATPDSIIVKWRTDVVTDAELSFGPAPGNLGSSAVSQTVATDHEVRLQGLQPRTRYYFAVGTSAQTLAGDDSFTFVTPPASDASVPTRVWIVGDSGTKNDNARNVRDAYKLFAGSRPANLWLMLGDNAYSDGTDSEYQEAVFDMYPTLLRQMPLWPTLGNHDGHTADSATQTGPYYDIFSLPTQAEAGGFPSGTEAYYSFDHGNIHFISLESYQTDRSPSGAMMIWLQYDLAANDKPWVIAFWHHPPYSKGSHDSDSSSRETDMREIALPILEAAGVDLVLSGHSHGYERSILLDGHYGTSGTLDPSMILDGGDGRDTGDGAYAKPASTPNEGARYEEAVKTAQHAIRLAPNNPTYRRQLAASYAMMDRIDDAQAALQEYLRLEPNHTIADSRKIPTKVPEHLERFLDGLRKAGLPE